MADRLRLAKKLKDGQVRPKLKLMAIEMIVCNVTFSTHTDYNIHCKLVHGVNTSAVYRHAPGAPPVEVNPEASGIQGMVEGLTHVMKNMSSKNDQPIPLCMLTPQPGKKDVTEGIKEFQVILKSTGK